MSNMNQPQKGKKNNLRNYSKSGTQRETTWTKSHGQRETTRSKEVTTDENFYNWPKSITHTPEMSNMNQSQKRKKIFLRKYSKPASQRETTWPNHTSIQSKNIMIW